MTNKEKEEIINELKKELTKSVTVYVEKIDKDITLPEYSFYGDACMDIRANLDVIIKPNETKIVPTGLKIAIPLGYEIQVRPRSGLSLKTTLRIPNSPGTIDSGYRDELGIIVHNISNKEDLIIKKGDRIAQIALCKIEKIIFKEVNDISNIGCNRGGGYGHTGLNN